MDPISVQKRDEADTDVIFLTWSNGDKKLAVNKDDLPKNKDGEVDTDAVFLALNNYRAKKLQGNEGVVEKRDENDADVIFVTWSNGDKKLASEEDGEVSDSFWDREATVLGLPLFPVAIFALWAALIALLGWMIERAPDD